MTVRTNPYSKQRLINVLIPHLMRLAHQVLCQHMADSPVEVLHKAIGLRVIGDGAAVYCLQLLQKLLHGWGPEIPTTICDNLLRSSVMHVDVIVNEVCKHGQSCIWYSLCNEPSCGIVNSRDKPTIA